MWVPPPDGIPGLRPRAIGLSCPRFLRQLSLLLPRSRPTSPHRHGCAPGVLQKWVFQCLSCSCGSCWPSAPIRSQPASGPTHHGCQNGQNLTGPRTNNPVTAGKASPSIQWLPLSLYLVACLSPQFGMGTAALEDSCHARTLSGTRTRMVCAPSLFKLREHFRKTSQVLSRLRVRFGCGQCIKIFTSATYEINRHAQFASHCPNYDVL